MPSLPRGARVARYPGGSLPGPVADYPGGSLPDGTPRPAARPVPLRDVLDPLARRLSFGDVLNLLCEREVETRLEE